MNDKRQALAADCVRWPGCKDRQGYGSVRFAGKMRRAHRVALERSLGRQLGRDEVAMHLCPNKDCINPAHLRAGTVKENNAETASRRRSLAKWLAETVPTP